MDNHSQPNASAPGWGKIRPKLWRVVGLGGRYDVYEALRERKPVASVGYSSQGDWMEEPWW